MFRLMIAMLALALPASALAQAEERPPVDCSTLDMSQAGPWSTVNVERPWGTEPDSSRELLSAWIFENPEELSKLRLDACPVKLSVTPNTLTIEGDVSAIKTFFRDSEVIRVRLASNATMSGNQSMNLRYSPGSRVFWVESKITGAAAPRLSYRTEAGRWELLEPGRLYTAAGDVDVRADTITTASFVEAVSIQLGGRRVFLRVAQP